MNYLGHAVFADGPGDFVLGALLADWVKGDERQALPPVIQDGIAAHEALDTFFDGFFRKGNVLAPVGKALRDEVGGYSNPFADMCADHIIASNWDRLFTKDLKTYVYELYEAIDPHVAQLYPKYQHLVQTMKDGNWLVRYQDRNGLEEALDRFTGRTKEKYRHKISDNKERIFDLLPKMEPLVLSVLPQVRAFTRDHVLQQGYEPETRIRWRENQVFEEGHRGGKERR